MCWPYADRARLLLSPAALPVAISITTQRVRLAADCARLLLLAAALLAAIGITTQRAGR